MEPLSHELTTISSYHGLYRYTRLPFGIASAPAIFQRTMDTILDGIPNVLCYNDNILITGKTKSEHLQNLQEVLGHLQAYGVRVKSDKCLFFQDSVTYLGHGIDASGIHATEDKLEAIFCAPPPRNMSQLNAFLGLLNYYGKFINNLTTVIHPLNQLLCRDVPWRWTSQCSQSFESAKQLLKRHHVLTHYDPSLPIRLAGNASNYGIGAMISHIMPDGTERPILCASRTLTKSEWNYLQVYLP